MKQKILVTREVFDDVLEYLEGYFKVDSTQSDSLKDADIFRNETEVGMDGINLPLPVPMAFFTFGGWKSSLFGDLHVHMHGMEGVYFDTRTKAISPRWADLS